MSAVSSTSLSASTPLVSAKPPSNIIVSALPHAGRRTSCVRLGGATISHVGRFCNVAVGVDYCGAFGKLDRLAGLALGGRFGLVRVAC
jgi:hypothetical protein